MVVINEYNCRNLYPIGKQRNTKSIQGELIDPRKDSDLIVLDGRLFWKAIPSYNVSILGVWKRLCNESIFSVDFFNNYIGSGEIDWATFREQEAMIQCMYAWHHE